jgi:hypothetical protein
MENYSAWITPAIWGMVVLNYAFCFILGREIAKDRGYPDEKSLVLGILGPISLVRFGLEKLTNTDLREALPIGFTQQSENSAPIQPSTDEYFNHPRYQDLLELVAQDEAAAIAQIDLEWEKKSAGSLDEWMDAAIQNSNKQPVEQKFQYAVEQYD